MAINTLTDREHGQPGEIAIVGAGIIGVCIALELQAAGQKIVLIDPNEPGTGAAAGSAGHLAADEVFPLARAGLLSALPRMLLDPLGPLVIRPAYAPRMLEWGLRFLLAMRSGRVAKGIQALASLNRGANDALLDLAGRVGAADLLERIGGLHVCRDSSNLAVLSRKIPVLREHGVEVELLTNAQLREREPALATDLAGALFFPGNGRCADPRAFGTRLAQYFQTRGGRVVRARALALLPQGDGTWDIATTFCSVHAEKVIIAGGVWSRELLEPLGHHVPIETERGYHLMLPESKVTLRYPIIFEEPHFAATTMNHGLRLAGTVEFAGTAAPMNRRRADILFPLAARYIPGIEATGATRWLGFRPSFPDSLPAIGLSTRQRNLVYCFGHQHLGLTQAAISARSVVELIMQRSATIDLQPFSLERFAA